MIWHRWLVVFFFLVCIWTAQSKRADYSGYTVHRFKIDRSADTMKKLENFEYDVNETANTARLLLDIWADPSKSNPYADVLVAPKFFAKFKSLLTPKERGTLKLLKGDIQSHINAEHRSMFQNSKRKKRNPVWLKKWQDFNISSYHSYEEMAEFMTVLARQKPDMVQMDSIATSFQGRFINGVRIRPPGARSDRHAIIVDAGVHAREWIAPAVALYLIKRLVSEYGVEPSITANMDKFDWHIVPQVNPDGYEYSRTTDRLWRKTRSMNLTVNRWCIGADANRNWGYRWGEAGANRTPCSNIYMGSHPYSEPEIRGLKDYFTYKIADPMIYASLHSYGQVLLTPWGYTLEKTHNYKDQQSAAREAVMAIRNTTGVIYSYGTISEMMYPASGTSIDFMQHRGVPYIYGVELRPTDKPNSVAFNLPPKYIVATGDEMMAALLAIGDHAVRTKKL